MKPEICFGSAWRLGTVLVMVLIPSMSANSALEQAATRGSDGATQQQMEQGAYLARAGDCAACHSAPDGQPFSGGLPLATPFGIIYSTNITPDPVHGIGQYSFEEFDRAMREGMARDGHHLYPAMPYSAFAKVSASDMHALFAYFIKGVKPAPTENRENNLRWPFSMRSLIAVWNLLYLDGGEYVAKPGQSAQWNRGAYLVQGLGHCGACHTPRGIAGQEEAYDESNGKRYLVGAVTDNWFAADLTADFGTGLSGWTKDEVTDYLKTGRTARSAAFGAMAQVVGASTQHLRDQDLTAIAEYLKSLPPASGVTVLASPAAADTTTGALRAGTVGSRGAQLYLDNCNTCHHSDGTGALRIFPSLAGSEMVNAPDVTSLIHIVLTGSAMPSTKIAPSALAMPDFAWRMSDQDVADVLSFVRSSWGNQAPSVAANDVGRLRKATEVK
jgi:mono/diheme cytochrome c family protein